MKPDAARLLARLKERLHRGEAGEVVEAYVDYLGAEPRDALAWTDLAGMLLALKRTQEALEACRRALALKPAHFPALCHLGAAFLQADRLDEAERQLQAVLRLDPGRLEIRLLLVKCLLAKGDPKAAHAVLEKVRQQDPGNMSAHQYLGQIYYGLGRWQEFQDELERFERLAPGSPYLEFERGFMNLLRGAMPLGWQQWEARLRVPGCVGPERSFLEPRWQGEDFADRTLLVHYEQGLGDTVMLARFLPRVKARGGRVLLLVQPQLVGLMTTCEGVDLVIPQGVPLPAFDLQVSLYSLPAVFQVDQDALGAEIPYLGIPARVPHRERIAEILAASAGRTRVGLAWAGFRGHARDAERSLPLVLVDRLGALPGVAWHGFQLGQTEEPDLPDYVSLAPCLGDFSDTAYALAGMDLVITVDTALAHVAGALGIPTLLLVTCIPDFRWMLDREDTPWYPTLQLYRQPRPGDWESVILRLLGNLGGDPQEGL